MIGIILLLLVVIAILLVYLIILKYRDPRLMYMGEKLPGIKRMPILGNILHVPALGPERIRIREEFIKKHGHLERIWIGYKLLVVLSDPSDVQVILNSTTLLGKGWTYEFFKPWLGTGLLISEGKKWHDRRKLITPSFHFKILEQFVEVFNKNGDVLVNKMEGEAATGEIFDVQPYITRYTLDVICETAMGVELNSQGAPSEYTKAVRGMCELLLPRMSKPWLWSNFIWFITGKKKLHDGYLSILHAFTNKVLANKKTAAEQRGKTLNELDMLLGLKRKTAFLEVLLSLSRQNSDVIRTDEDIREEVDTFMFEGHDTTTSGICAILFLLAKHPNIQERVFEEVQKLVSERNGDSDVTYQDIQGLKYLERVIKECLRLYPPVPAVARHLTDDLPLPSGHILPRGTNAIVSLYLLHRNEFSFPNPGEFNPDNFLPEVSARRHPFAYCPFSAGPRNCIGQKFAMAELKCTIIKLIMKYKFVYGGPATDVVSFPGIVLRSQNGYQIRIEKR